MRTKEHVMDHYPANAEGWGTAIQLLHELATEKDVKRLSAYCEDIRYYNKHLGESRRFTKLGFVRSGVITYLI